MPIAPIKWDDPLPSGVAPIKWDDTPAPTPVSAQPEDESLIDKWDKLWINTPQIRKYTKGNVPLSTGIEEKYDPIEGRTEDQAKIPNWVPYVGGGTWRSLGAGELKSWVDAVEGMTAPLPAAAALASGGAGMLAKGAPAIAESLGMLGRGLSLPFIGSGTAHAYKGIKEGSPLKTLQGVAEAAGGAAGAFHPGSTPVSFKPMTAAEIAAERGIPPPPADVPPPPVETPSPPTKPHITAADFVAMREGRAPVAPQPEILPPTTEAPETPPAVEPQGQPSKPMPVPNGVVNDDFIAKMAKGGFSVVGKDEKSTFFGKIIGNEKGIFNPNGWGLEYIAELLRKGLGREPTPAEINTAKERLGLPNEGEDMPIIPDAQQASEMSTEDSSAHIDNTVKVIDYFQNLFDHASQVGDEEAMNVAHKHMMDAQEVLNNLQRPENPVPYDPGDQGPMTPEEMADLHRLGQTYPDESNQFSPTEYEQHLKELHDKARQLGINPDDYGSLGELADAVENWPTEGDPYRRQMPPSRDHAVQEVNDAFQRAQELINDGAVTDARQLINDAADRLNRSGFANEADQLRAGWTRYENEFSGGETPNEHGTVEQRQQEIEQRYQKEGRALDKYRLPDGRIVPVDATATKGAETIDFGTKEGNVQAEYVGPMGTDDVIDPETGNVKSVAYDPTQSTVDKITNVPEGPDRIDKIVQLIKDHINEHGTYPKNPEIARLAAPLVDHITNGRFSEAHDLIRRTEDLKTLEAFSDTLDDHYVDALTGDADYDQVRRIGDLLEKTDKWSEAILNAPSRDLNRINQEIFGFRDQGPDTAFDDPNDPFGPRPKEPQLGDPLPDFPRDWNGNPIPGATPRTPEEIRAWYDKQAEIQGPSTYNPLDDMPGPDDPRWTENQPPGGIDVSQLRMQNWENERNGPQFSGPRGEADIRLDRPMPPTMGQQELSLGPVGETRPRELIQDAWTRPPEGPPPPEGQQPEQTSLPPMEGEAPRSAWRDRFGRLVEDERGAVGKNIDEDPIIDKFRKGLPLAKGFSDTRFILPDGTRLTHSSVFHESAANDLGVSLNQALEAGVIRYAGGGNAEVRSPITYEQAQTLVDAVNSSPDKNGYIEVYPGKGRNDFKMLNDRSTAAGIRNWVNGYFRDPELGALNIGDMWQGTKNATGWGQGGAEQPKPDPNKFTIRDFVREAMEIPSGLTTTLDASYPGRQGLSQILTPEFWLKALPSMAKSVVPKFFDEIHANLLSKDIAQPLSYDASGKPGKSMLDEMGIKIFEPAESAAPNKRMENIASRWLETGGSIPVLSKVWKHTIGYPIRASNRMFITMANVLRVNRAETLMNLARDMAIKGVSTGRMPQPGILGGYHLSGGRNIGFTKSVSFEEALNMDPYTNLQAAREIGDFVNTATGVAPQKTHLLPFKQAEFNMENPTNVLEKSAAAVSKLLFSPGQFMSRVRMLNPSTYIMASPMMRQQYMKAALSTAAAWYAFTTMIKKADPSAEVSDDPTSADFGKVRIGNTRMDASGGFLPFLVAYARMYQGGATSSSTGQYHKFGEGYQAQTQEDMMQRFFVNKLKPVPKFIYDIASATQYNPFHVGDRVMQLFVPLAWQDLYEIQKEDPSLLPKLAAPVMFGAGSQIYDKGESVGKFIDPENDWLVQGGGLRNLMPWNYGEDNQ